MIESIPLENQLSNKVQKNRLLRSKEYSWKLAEEEI